MIRWSLAAVACVLLHVSTTAPEDDFFGSEDIIEKQKSIVEDLFENKVIFEDFWI